MALDPEELKRRRQERDRRRKQQHRKLVIRLVIAGAVLVALAVGIVLFVTLRQPVQEQNQPEQTYPADTVIRLAAAGDLNITDAVVQSGGEALDYTEAFKDVAHLLADADISVVNFEGNLTGAPYGSENYSAPQSMAQALANAGVDLVQLANSYSISEGILGLCETIDGIRAAGMEPLGVYADQAAYSAGKGYTIREVQGIRIAFVAFTKGMDGMTLPAGSENCVNVLYTDYDSNYQTVNEEKINAVLDAARTQSPDLVVALLHWGSEFNDTISGSQEKIASLLQEKGVDAIIGTHSHYVQQMTHDQESGSFVAYSLGDFFGDAQRAGSEYSVILELEITKSGVDGSTRITGFDYTPIFTVTDPEQPYRVVRIAEAIAAYELSYMKKVSQEAYEDMKYALTRIEKRISGE